jgi:hypothetical protein
MPSGIVLESGKDAAMVAEVDVSPITGNLNLHACMRISTFFHSSASIIFLVRAISNPDI